MRRNLHNNNLKVTWQWVRSVITLWELLTKCQTVIFIMNSSDELSCLPTDFISTWWWVKIRIWRSTSGKPLYTKYMSWIFVAFPKVKARLSHSWCWLRSRNIATHYLQEEYKSLHTSRWVISWLALYCATTAFNVSCTIDGKTRSA